MAVVIEKPPLWRRVAPVLQGYDGPFLLAVLLLAGIGLGVMYSVGHDVDGRFVAHARNMAIAAGVMFVAAVVIGGALLYRLKIRHQTGVLAEHAAAVAAHPASNDPRYDAAEDAVPANAAMATEA